MYQDHFGYATASPSRHMIKDIILTRQPKPQCELPRPRRKRALESGNSWESLNAATSAHRRRQVRRSYTLYCVLFLLASFSLSYFTPLTACVSPPWPRVHWKSRRPSSLSKGALYISSSLTTYSRPPFLLTPSRRTTGIHLQNVSIQQRPRGLPRRRHVGSQVPQPRGEGEDHESKPKHCLSFTLTAMASFSSF